MVTTEASPPAGLGTEAGVGLEGEGERGGRVKRKEDEGEKRGRKEQRKEEARKH